MQILFNPGNRFATLLVTTLAAGIGLSGSARAGFADSKSKSAVKTKGIAYQVIFNGETVSYCDGAGSHLVKLPNTLPENGPSPCSKRPKPYEPSTCTGVDISSPANKPDDVVETGDWSTPVTGRVHACAELDGNYAVVTGSAVLFLDDKGKKTMVDNSGGEDIWTSRKWTVWAANNELYFTKSPQK